MLALCASASLSIVHRESAAHVHFSACCAHSAHLVFTFCQQCPPARTLPYVLWLGSSLPSRHLPRSSPTSTGFGYLTPSLAPPVTSPPAIEFATAIEGEPFFLFECNFCPCLPSISTSTQISDGRGKDEQCQAATGRSRASAGGRKSRAEK